MAKVEVKGKERSELGKQSDKVRRSGFIPAVVYGSKFSATPVAVDAQEFTKKILRSESGTNLIFNLVIENGKNAQTVPVITYALQRNPVTDDIIHIDFKHIVMDEKIKAKIPVELVGIPIGVKDENGVLVHGLREIEIRCFPGDLPDKYTVDASNLKINDSLQVSDLPVSNKIEIISSQNELIASVTLPTKEEEVAAPAPVLTPEEAAAAEAGAAAAEESVKEKAAPGAAPVKEKTAPAKEKAASEDKK
ncbi:MAG: 50S ribosomal protein L25 [Candidatus Margulisbacteria bacterium]|nr:50S ribosomal protein L25 [Candidatus Margulisiibacteriota bacterium]